MVMGTRDKSDPLRSSMHIEKGRPLCLEQGWSIFLRYSQNSGEPGVLSK